MTAIRVSNDFYVGAVALLCTVKKFEYVIDNDLIETIYVNNVVYPYLSKFYLNWFVPYNDNQRISFEKEFMFYIIESYKRSDYMTKYIMNVHALDNIVKMIYTSQFKDYSYVDTPNYIGTILGNMHPLYKGIAKITLSQNDEVSKISSRKYTPYVDAMGNPFFYIQCSYITKFMPHLFVSQLKDKVPKYIIVKLNSEQNTVHVLSLKIDLTKEFETICSSKTHALIYIPDTDLSGDRIPVLKRKEAQTASVPQRMFKIFNLQTSQEAQFTDEQLLAYSIDMCLVRKSDNNLIICNDISELINTLNASEESIFIYIRATRQYLYYIIRV